MYTRRRSQPGEGRYRQTSSRRATQLYALLDGLLATLGALVVGLAGFFHGGEFNRKYSNKLMQARVVLQAIAVFLLLMLLLGVGRS